MTKQVVVSGVTPKGYARILEIVIRAEADPRALVLWQQAQQALAAGGVREASSIMQQAKAVSTLYKARPEGGYDIV